MNVQTETRADFEQLTLDHIPQEDRIRCYACHGPADRVELGKAPGPHIASCSKCRAERGEAK